MTSVKKSPWQLGFCKHCLNVLWFSSTGHARYLVNCALEIWMKSGFIRTNGAVFGQLLIWFLSVLDYLHGGFITTAECFKWVLASILLKIGDCTINTSFFSQLQLLSFLFTFKNHLLVFCSFIRSLQQCFLIQLDHILDIFEIANGFPSTLLNWVPFPLNKVQCLFALLLLVKDCLNLVEFFIWLADWRLEHDCGAWLLAPCKIVFHLNWQLLALDWPFKSEGRVL